MKIRFSFTLFFVLMLAVPLWAADATLDLPAEWTKFIGAGLPPVIAVILGCQWKTWLKAVVSFLIITVVSGVTCYVENRLDVTHWPDTMLWILMTSGATFWMFWRPSGIAQWIEQSVMPKGLLPFSGAIWNKIDKEAEERALEVNYPRDYMANGGRR